MYWTDVCQCATGTSPCCGVYVGGRPRVDTCVLIPRTRPRSHRSSVYTSTTPLATDRLRSFVSSSFVRSLSPNSFAPSAFAIGVLASGPVAVYSLAVLVTVSISTVLVAQAVDAPPARGLARRGPWTGLRRSRFFSRFLPVWRAIRTAAIVVETLPGDIVAGRTGVIDREPRELSARVPIGARGPLALEAVVEELVVHTGGLARQWFSRL